MARRGSGVWAAPVEPAEVGLEVLIPTSGRIAELAVTLAGLAAQDGPAFGVIVSDQSEDGRGVGHPSVQAMVRVLRAQGRPVRLERHVPRRGLAEHRQFLLDQSVADEVLYLDDDVWLEPGQLERLSRALGALGCGFVGAAVQGLSYLEDERPDQQRAFELWGPEVQPERIRRDASGFGRWPLHNAANMTHIARRVPLPEDGWAAYKIAWVGGCVLFRRSALVETGGFEFARDLPPGHAGEDVAAQWRVMERFGGAGILPSGAVHLESPTTVTDRSVEVFDLVLD